MAVDADLDLGELGVRSEVKHKQGVIALIGDNEEARSRRLCAASRICRKKNNQQRQKRENAAIHDKFLQSNDAAACVASLGGLTG